MNIAVVIPSYRVKRSILPLISKVGPEVASIYVVDDCCPEQSGRYVEQNCTDSRVTVVYHSQNQGVGGATISGYRAALENGADIVVKMDGDGQMAPALIPTLVQPIRNSRADYVKGNRFFSLDSLSEMPPARLFGNSLLSFINKAVSGYWNLMDPTNGFTAIHRQALSMIPMEKLDRRYFFESDMLFRLNTLRAVVVEIPMRAKYGDEESGLRIWQVMLDFPGKYLVRLLKRIFYNYFLRDFSVCSVQIVLGSLLLFFGLTFGVREWIQSISQGVPASTGTVMLASLPVILGFQLLLQAVSFDVSNVPQVSLRSLLDLDSETEDYQLQPSDKIRQFNKL